MKQLEDNKTIDMFDGSHIKPKTYRFYVRCENGFEMHWTGLSRNVAIIMYNATGKQRGTDVTAYGWSEE